MEMKVLMEIVHHRLNHYAGLSFVKAVCEILSHYSWNELNNINSQFVSMFITTFKIKNMMEVNGFQIKFQKLTFSFHPFFQNYTAHCTI